jgi:hypothetical protein
VEIQPTGRRSEGVRSGQVGDKVDITWSTDMTVAVE